VKIYKKHEEAHKIYLTTEENQSQENSSFFCAKL